MVTHTWKLISHAWFFIWRPISQLFSANVLGCSCHDFPINHRRDHRNLSSNTMSFFGPLLLTPHPSLLFAAFYTCILFHAFINPSPPCPHLSSNRISCSKSVSSKLRSRASLMHPFDPLGTGLLSVTWGLQTLSRPAQK